MHHHPLISFTLGVAVASLGLAPKLALAQPSAHEEAQLDPSAAPLLRQAHFLLSFYRVDLARNVLQKVLAVQHDHPEALFMLGDLALREGDNQAAAALLERLKLTHPDSPFARDMAALWQLHTVDRLRLTQLRSLRADGNVIQASRLAQELFPDNLPPGSLLPEFVDLLANTPTQRTAVIQALPRRLAYSGSPRDRLALYSLQSQNSTTLLASLPGFAQIARERSVPPDQFAGPWRRALDWARRNGAGPEGVRIAAADEALYQRSIPPDVRFAVVPYPVTNATAASPAGPVKPALVSIDLRPAFAALDEGRLSDAQSLFKDALRRQPTLGAASGGLGIIRLRQGQLQEAQTLFDKAAANEPEPKAKTDWQSLAQLAQYKRQLGNARELLRAGQLAEADTLLQSTLPLASDPSEATLMLADLRTRRGQAASADALYARLLAATPDDAYVWRSRFVNGVRHPEVGRSAEAWLDEIGTQAQRWKLQTADMMDADALREAADREVAAGHLDVAERLLERGLAIEPMAPWLRHDLARLYLHKGRTAEALALMDEGVARTPADSQMRHAAALIAQAAGHDELALAQLDAIPQDERTANHNALHSAIAFELALRQHRQALVAGDKVASQAAVRRADRETQGLVDRSLRLGRAEVEAGLPELALKRLDSIALAQLSLPQQIEAAQLRSLAGQEAVGQQQLAALAAQAQAPEKVDAVLQAQEAQAARRIERAQLGGRPSSEVIALADGALPGWPSNDGRTQQRRSLALARLYVAAKAPQKALDTLNSMAAPIASEPGYTEWARTRVQAYHAAGLRDEARQALRELREQRSRQETTKAPGAQRAAGAVDGPLLDVALANDIGDYDSAQQWLEPLLAAHPNDADVRLEASRAALGTGHYNEAAAHLRAGQASRASASVASASHSLMAVLDQRRQPRFEAGAMWVHDSGSQGISKIRAREIPMRLTWPVGYEGHAFVQVDAVKLDAGTLPTAFASVADFGTVRSANAAGPTNLAAPIAQSEQGYNLAVGWQEDRQRLDIGVIGLGMPIRNWVGGWQKTIQRKDTDLGIELARRVEVHRLLPYVGAVDPITGQSWGGVTRTSAALSLARPLNPTDRIQSTLKAAYYDGQHVRHNSALQWRTALTRDVRRSQALNLNVGVAAMLWHFQHNSNFYSWGHGGYYSPQRYASLSLPVELSGRLNDWSYLLRASASYAWAREDTAPYYPLDPNLSAGAGYSGGKSQGLGGSLRAMIERRITSHWDLGAWLDVDRSENYSPTRGMVYLRYHFKAQGDPVPVPPQPVQPYSQF